MRDGITTSSGNSRYLKSVENFLSLYPNYEAFANALIAGTLPIDLNGINPAGWQQLGTSLNKANLMSDETESAIFGNAADRTVSQALAGLNRAANKLKLIAKYTVAGAYEWTCPEDGEYIAVIIGGGQSGSAIATKGSSVNHYAIGGASGCVAFCRKQISKDEVKALVVGAGGAGVSLTYVSNMDNTETGNAGGTSSFDGVTAAGGESGYGGQNSSPSLGTTYSKYPPCGGVPVSDHGSSFNYISTTMASQGGAMILANFLDENCLPITHLCAGGTAYFRGGGESEAIPLANGKTMSPAKGSNATTATLTTDTPTDCGAGSGGIAVYNSELVSVDLTTGNGADGGVFIYKIQGAAA